MGYIYVAGTIVFTVLGQILLKWRLSQLGFVLPDSSVVDKVLAMLKVIFDPVILIGFVSAFIASIFWLGAMSKFEITHVYPFMSISPALVFIVGVFVMGETFTI
ncbi:MAG: hypothetical protein RR293_07710, partial [Bacteroidales bacterium]